MFAMIFLERYCLLRISVAMFPLLRTSLAVPNCYVPQPFARNRGRGNFSGSGRRVFPPHIN